LRILVTGGAGFIGSHLARQLAHEGHKVTIIDDLSGGFKRNIPINCSFIKGDLCDKEICNKATKNIDVVFHLAAHAAEGQSHFCPVHNAEKNYMGFLELYKNCINNGVKKFIFFSSMAVYGESPKLPMDESMIRNPEDPYGICKSSIERFLEIEYKVHGLEYVILRPHNVVGTNQRMNDPYRNVVSIFLNRVLKNEPLLIYGDGEQTRAFTYVDDIIPFVIKCMSDEVINKLKLEDNRVLNIGNDVPTSINELARLVCKETSFNKKPIHVEGRIEVKHAYCSKDKAERILGYVTKNRIDVIVKNMVKWIKDNNIVYEPFVYFDSLEIVKNAPNTWVNKLL